MIFLGRKIDKHSYPFIVAEISCNHEGKVDNAKRLIDAAKEAGADAVKIQMYRKDDLTIQNYGPDFVIKDGEWIGRALYTLYGKTETDINLASDMIAYAQEINFPLFASVFSQKMLAAAQCFDIPAYKIASPEIVDTYFIRKVAKTGKPIVLSTGMANLEEIDEAMNCVNPENAILMHCVSAYPTRLDQANLWRISYLQNLFNCPVGFSDHTKGFRAGALAVAAGARVLEKHLALEGTVTEDAAFSLFPKEFKRYVQEARIASEAMARVEVPDEIISRQFRRSIYVVKTIKQGESFTLDNIRAIRPGYGYKAAELPKLLYKRAKVDIEEGTALKAEMIDG